MAVAMETSGKTSITVQEATRLAEFKGLFEPSPGNIFKMTSCLAHKDRYWQFPLDSYRIYWLSKTEDTEIAKLMHLYDKYEIDFKKVSWHSSISQHCKRKAF